ncbi:TPA_asm: nucleocapsid protein [Artemisia virus 1]|uniref:Nucleoprotein n=1 Tax=Artemisia virus 1 TaxID=2977954 RepID=A0A9N7AAS7_9RHAB|nr:TPA_asm: nucleocapsid protein [Artemisia virus 1]
MSTNPKALLEEITKLLGSSTVNLDHGDSVRRETNEVERVATINKVTQDSLDQELEELYADAALSIQMPKTSFWGARPDYGAVTGSKDDWPDDMLKNLKTYTLRRYKIEDLCDIGEQAFESIHGEFNKKAIVQLLNLAYNLKDNENVSLMANYDKTLIDPTASIPIKAVSTTTLCMGQLKNMNMDLDHMIRERNKAAESLRRRALGYCYLAASYLRLFSKSVENVKKIHEHLRNKFTNFYKFEFPFDEFHADADVIKEMRNQFDLDDRLRNTLYVILYAGRECKVGKDLKDFLYQIHLNYTGLQPFVLWLKCLSNLKTKCGVFADSLQSPSFEEQIDAVSRLMELEHTKHHKYEKQMWKFARIFDKDFMSVLQIKHCMSFSLTLAHIVALTQSADSRDSPLDIQAFKNASDEEKAESKTIALGAITLVRRAALGPLHAKAANARVIVSKRRRMM